MGRPQTINDEDILQAARAVFLERGIRATTAEVAARAGISSGSLFNRFKSKEDLFFAAMTRTEAPDWVIRLASRTPLDSLDADLEEIASDALAFFRHIVPLAMMMWSNACDMRFKGEQQRIRERTVGLVADYFRASVREGHMRADANPVMSAHIFCGTIHNFAVLEHLVGEAAKDETDEKLREFVRIFVHGTKNESSSKTPSKASAKTSAKTPAKPTSKLSSGASARKTARPATKRR